MLARDIFHELKLAFPNNQIIAYLKGIGIHITKEKDFEYIRGWISTP
jgi:hypothetical protein